MRWNLRGNRLVTQMPKTTHCYPPQQRRHGPSGFAKRILMDDRGAVIVEFGFVAAPFFALIFATLLTALIMFTQQALDTVAEASAREFMTGQVQKGAVQVTDPVTGTAVKIDSNAKLKIRVCDKIKSNGLGFLNCNRVMVSVKKLATFSAADYNPVVLNYDPTSGAVTNAPGTFDTIGQEEIGLVTVYYRWPKLIGPLLAMYGNQSNGERLMVSNAIFKTETYNQ
jgi:Flp pilus assembly protein TadG